MFSASSFMVNFIFCSIVNGPSVNGGCGVICAEALGDTFVRIYRDFQFIFSSIVTPKNLIHKLARMFFLWFQITPFWVFFVVVLFFLSFHDILDEATF